MNFFILAGMTDGIESEGKMTRKKFIKLQIALWIIIGLLLGLSAETMINTLMEMIVGIALVLFCFGVALMNYRLYEAEEE